MHCTTLETWKKNTDEKKIYNWTKKGSPPKFPLPIDRHDDSSSCSSDRWLRTQRAGRDGGSEGCGCVGWGGRAALVVALLLFHAVAYRRGHAHTGQLHRLGRVVAVHVHLNHVQAAVPRVEGGLDGALQIGLRVNLFD